MPLTLEHIGADAQQLILLMCDFATLQSVLATSQQLSAHALAVLSSAAWRQSSINEDQLHVAAWYSGEIEEACHGANGRAGSISNVTIAARTVVCTSTADNRAASNGLAIGSHQVKAFDAVDAKLTHSLGAAGLVLQVAISRSESQPLLAALVRPSAVLGNSVRLFDLAPDQPASVGGRALELGNGLTTPLWLTFHENGNGEEDLVVYGRVGRPPGGDDEAYALQVYRSVTVSSGTVGLPLPFEMSLRASASFPQAVLPAARPSGASASHWHSVSNIHQLPLIRISHHLCVVVLEDTDISDQALVLSYPSLLPLRRLRLRQPGSCLATGRLLIRGLDASRVFAMDSSPRREGSPTLLAFGTSTSRLPSGHESAGRVLLWDLSSLSSLAAASIDDGNARALPSKHADIATAAAESVALPPLAHTSHVEPTRVTNDCISRKDTSCADPRRLPLGWVCSVAVSRRLVAATVNVRGVFVWDGLTRLLLRRIELPSRTHAGFHPNIIVPNSLSLFGVFGLAIEGTRLALAADVTEGDWRPPIELPGGRTEPARSLLVVQEVGPEWLRET